MAEKENVSTAMFVKAEPGVIVSEIGLDVGQRVCIDREEHQMLDDVIQFGDGCVKTIELVRDEDWWSSYHYKLIVRACGPTDGDGYLYFTDSDKPSDCYSLKIHAHAEATHTVRYNSDAPKIKIITWKYEA